MTLSINTINLARLALLDSGSNRLFKDANTEEIEQALQELDLEYFLRKEELYGRKAIHLSNRGNSETIGERSQRDSISDEPGK